MTTKTQGQDIIIERPNMIRNQIPQAQNLGHLLMVVRQAQAAVLTAHQPPQRLSAHQPPQRLSAHQPPPRLPVQQPPPRLPAQQPPPLRKVLHLMSNDSYLSLYLKAPFNVLSFKTLPNGNMSTYFVLERRADGTSVDVKVASGAAAILNADSQLQYLFFAYVEDNGSPALSDTALVTVNVNRNSNKPQFLNTTVTVTIPENENPGDVVATCRATDSDSSNTPNGQVIHMDATTDSNTKNYFRVLENGDVVLQRELTRDRSVTRYIVLIKARDNGAFPLEADNTCTVTINVNQDQFDPQFMSPCDSVIERTATSGQTIVTATATDNDSTPPFNIVTYAIVRQPTPAIFTINSTSGVISLTANVAGQSSSVFSIVISATDGGSPSRSAFNLCTFTVNNNLNAPVFTSPGSTDNYMATTEILETHPFNQMVYQVTATDPDQGLSGTLVYSLTGTPSGQQYFQINPDTGVITLRAALLSDTSLTYTLTVIARDRDPVPKQTPNQATVIVNVYRNTYTPAFINEPSYSRTVRQDITVGTSITQVTATDADRVNTYEKVTYDLIGDGNAPGYVRIDASNGVVTLQSSLNGVTTNVIYVRVRASDNGTPPKTNITTFTISLNQNLQTPYWTDPTNPSFSPTSPAYVYTINEDQLLYQPFGRLSSTDQDTSPPLNSVTYSLVNLGQATQYFQIDYMTGAISLKSPLPSSGFGGITLQAVASDGGFPSLSTTCSVQINVQTDSGTLTLPYYQKTIPESTAIGGDVITVQATPADGVSYSIVGVDTGPTYFSINPTSGQITVKADLKVDRYRKDPYILRVRALRTFQVTTQEAFNNVSITVERNPNGPISVNLSYVRTISQDSAIGSSVIQINASDADGDSLLYTVVSPTTGSDYFYVSPSTGLIVVSKPLANSGLTRVDFQVNVSDQAVGNPKSITVSVTIFITGDIPPVFTNPNNYQANIPFTQPVGSSVYTVSATDADLQQSLEFVATCGLLSAPGYFAVNSTTGVVSVINSLTNDVTSTYRLCVITYDTARPNAKATATVTINVNRNPNAPSFTTTTYSATVYETADFGTSLFNITAVDPDNSSIEYRVISSTPSDCVNYFNLHPNTGRFSTSGDLVRTRPATSCQARYKVRRYEIVPDAVYSQLFSVNQVTGALSLSQSLSNRPENEFKIEIRAIDGGTPNLIGVTTVLIPINRNQFAPRFLTTGNQTVTLDEDLPPQLIATVSATDDDATAPYNRLNFTQVGGSAQSANFFSTDFLGRVYLIGRLSTPGTPDTFTLQIRVCDQAPSPLCAAQDAFVLVNVIRNHPPYFVNTPYQVALNNLSPGSPVLTAEGRDSDPVSHRFGQLTYSLIGDNGAETRFSINSQSGAITVSNNPSSAGQSPFSVRIQVCDGGNLCNVTVAIVAVSDNNNPPALTQPPYTATIPETWAYGDTIIDVNATDIDPSPPNNEIEYEIAAGSTNDRSLDCFAINPTFGYIFSKRSLREDPCNATNMFQFQVRANDKGTPSRSSPFAAVTINIIRNNNSPRWEQPVYIYNITVNQQTNSIIGRIRATDADPLVPFGTLSYTVIGGGNGNSFFTVNKVSNNDLDVILSQPLTGSMTMEYRSPWNLYYFRASPVNSYFTISSSGQVSAYRNLYSDTSRPTTYTLTSEIYDGGNPSLTGSQLATITITVNRNLYCPEFINLPNSTTIFLNSTGTIFVVMARDQDTYSLYNKPTITLIGDTGVSAYFSFSQATGAVSVLPSIANSNTNQFQLSFQVTDGYCNTPRQATLIVNLQRNQSPPRWTLGQDNITILEIQDTAQAIYNLSRFATDPDAGSLTYQYAPGSLNQDRFFIDTQGQVFLRRTLVGQGGDPYTAQFALRDEGGLTSGTFTLTVNVIRNHKPTITINPANITIDRTQATNIEFARCSSTDPDTDSPFNQVSYSLIGDASATNLFAVNPQSCVITLVNSISSVPGTSYTLRIQVQDGGTPSLTDVKTLTINVNGNLASPTFQPSQYSVTILETRPVGETLLQVTATDSDTYAPNNMVTYSIVNSTYSQLFGINPLTGAVYCIAWQAYYPNKQITTFTFDVNAVDQGNPARQATGYARVTVNVIRNTAPYFTNANNYQIAIAANQTEGAPFFTVTSADNDGDNPFNILTLSIQGDGNAASFFGINQNGGIFVKPGSNLPGAAESQYMIRVQVTDGGTPPLSAIAFLNVTTTRNQFSPVISGTTVTIPYTTIRGQLITTLNATDGDSPNRPEGQIRYSILNGAVLNSITYFYLDQVSGALTLTDNTDLRNIDRFTLTVQAADMGNPIRSATAQVIVLIQKDNATLMVPNYNFTINEGVAVGVLVGRVVASPSIMRKFEILDSTKRQLHKLRIL